MAGFLQDGWDGRTDRGPGENIDRKVVEVLKLGINDGEGMGDSEDERIPSKWESLSRQTGEMGNCCLSGDTGGGFRL